MIVQLIDLNKSTVRTAEKLAASGQAAQHMEPAFALIGADMMRATEARFSSEGRRGGGSWKQLSEKYADYEGRSRTTRILRRSDSLFRSLTVPEAPYQVLAFDQNNVVQFGTERPFAEVHQRGGGNKVPARPFLRFMQSDLNRWTRIMSEHLVKSFQVP